MKSKIVMPFLLLLVVVIGFIAGYYINEKEVQRLNETITQQESTRAFHEQDIELLRQTVEELENTISNFLEDTDESNRKIIEVEAQMKKLEEKNSQLKNDISSLIRQDREKNYKYKEEVIASTSGFKLYSPRNHESLDINEGFSFHGEIHKDVIGDIAVQIIDEDGNELYSLLIDENMFDDGVDLEWTSFAMRMRLLEEPTNRNAIFKVVDQQRNEVFEIPVSFVG